MFIVRVSCYVLGYAMFNEIKRRLDGAVQIATEHFRIATEVLRTITVRIQSVTVGFRRATEGTISEQ
jgi:hypothetical protein